MAIIRRKRIRKPRGRGLRTTTGCTTCRRRHLKCDEAKPLCGPCVKADRDCVYGESESSIFTVTETETPRRNVPESPRTALASPSETPVLNESQDAQVYSPCDGRNLHENADQPHVEIPITSPSVPNPYTPSNQIESPHVSDAGTQTSGPTLSTAAVRWFGLLATDAAREAVPTGVEEGIDWSFLDYDTVWEPVTPLQQATKIVDHQVEQNVISPRTQESERELWQSPETIQLLPKEHVLFENFINRISQWIDLFDPMKQFATFVPHLAVRNPGLMNAILALSCRHLSLNPSIEIEEPPDRNSALQYYYQTLHYVQKAMRHPTYQTSLELLATTLIISTYEMLDGSCKDWERHLEGVFWIQRSQVIHSESGGLKSAIWWAWLCQDIWAAFRERRKTFTFWTPKKQYPDMCCYEVASRAVWIMAQVVNYCSREQGKCDLPWRIERAAQLRGLLDEWRRHLTVEFEPLPTLSSESVFQPIWIRPATFGA
ncbi:hypothetical protein AWENTII_010700 [Aspergillus wentii]